MIIAFITDLFDYEQSNNDVNSARRKAFEELEVACQAVKAELHVVSLDGVVQAKTDMLDVVYNSDVLVVDMSIKNQQFLLNYHIGVREHLSRFDNIVLVLFSSGKVTEELNGFLGQRTKLFPYVVTDAGLAVSMDDRYIQSAVWEDDNLRNQVCSGLPPVSEKLERTFSELETRNRATMKERFIADIRCVREMYKGAELRERLRTMRRRLDDPDMLSPDVLLNMLLSYRDCEDYDAMVTLVEDVRKLPMRSKMVELSMIQYLYAFALNGRKQPGDRDRALTVINNLLSTCENPSADMFGLLGRIHKDRFVESKFTDQDALKAAIESYRSGFQADPNEYMGVNLANLLVCSGVELSSSLELRRICNVLNLRIGRKGDISKLTDYWDVATFFEVRVLSEEYTSAVRAVERIYAMDPPIWQIASTLRNIRLINHFRKPAHDKVKVHASRKLFDFWMEFLSDVVNESGQSLQSSRTGTTGSSIDLNNDGNLILPNGDLSDSINGGRVRSTLRDTYPVLVSETHSDSFEPAYVQINVTADPKSLRIWFYLRESSPAVNVPAKPFGCTEEDCLNLLDKTVSASEEGTLHDVSFTAEHIKGISLTQKNNRAVYLYTVYYSHDYCLSFSCEATKHQFYMIVRDSLFSADEPAGFLLDDDPQDPVRFEYELDDNGQRIVLGKGSFGTVYSGRELTREVKIAIKALNNISCSEYESFREEIRLHSRLNHRNIVRYLGSEVCDGVFVILMELVPGGSLSSLLRKYGPLKEEIVASYSMQILEGLKYLHDNRIIHRDIKADNVLVNMYTGDIKITDFGTSKRLIGLDPRARTVAGTMRYMAPELVVGRRGYGYPVDIWSFGCTVVEMLTASVPFVELDNALAAFYQIGHDNQHPNIPSDVSPECHSFIMRTFVANPDERATASQLLLDEFIEKHRKSKRRAKGKNARTPDHVMSTTQMATAASLPKGDDVAHRHQHEHDDDGDDDESEEEEEEEEDSLVVQDDIDSLARSQATTFASLNRQAGYTSRTSCGTSTIHTDSTFSLADRLRQHFLSLFGCCSNPIPATYGHSSSSPRRQPQRVGSGLFKRSAEFLSLAPTESGTLNSQATSATHAPASAYESGHFVLPSEVDVGQLLGVPVQRAAEMEDVPAYRGVLHGNSEPSVPSAIENSNNKTDNSSNSFAPGKDLQPKRSNGEEPVISSRIRDRLAATGEVLPRLKLRDRLAPSSSLKLSDSMSTINRSLSTGPTPTPTTASFGASADAFGFVKQDSEARHLLNTALQLEKKSILTTWHQLISQGTGVRLPLPPSSSSAFSLASSSPAFKTPPSPMSSPKHVPVVNASPQGKRNSNAHAPTEPVGTPGSLGNRDAFELELLECLLDMLLDHLEGGSAWNNMAQYLIRPTRVTRSTPGVANTTTSATTTSTTAATTTITTTTGSSTSNAISDNHSNNNNNSNNSDVGLRFDRILRRLIEQYQGGLQGTVSLPNSPLLFEFIRMACLMMWTAFEKPLCRQLNRPHELLAWHKLISDAAASAVNQLAALDEYGDVVRRPAPNGMLQDGRVMPLRRHRTFAVRGGAAAAHARDEFNRASLQSQDDRFDSSAAATPGLGLNTPLRSRARPLSIAYHSNYRQRTLSFESDPNATTAVATVDIGPDQSDAASRRRASFARASERSSLFRRSGANLGTFALPEELNEDDNPPDGFVELPNSSTLFGTTAHRRLQRRHTALGAQVDEEREQTERLTEELVRVCTEHNQLLTAIIRQKQSENDHMRCLAPEASVYSHELSTGCATLSDWFSSLNLNRSDMEKLSAQGITDEVDFLQTATKEDLWRLNLSGGAVMRIWNSLTKLRQAASVTAISHL